MGPPFKLYLPTKNQLFLCVDKWKRERSSGELQYIRSKLVGSYNIKVFRRYYNGFTFYFEQTIYYVKKSVTVKVTIEKPCLIFIYVISGDLHSANPEQSLTAQRLCFAHLAPAGEYSWLVPIGKKKVLFFTLEPEWLIKMSAEFPELVKISNKIINGDVPNEIFPHYHMTVKTLKHLDKLMRFKFRSRMHLESEFLKIINILVKEYQLHLIKPNKIENKPNNLIGYEVRDHIINLVEKGIVPLVFEISTTFNIEAKTLRRICNGVFNMNVQELITDAQMKKAYNLLKRGMLVKEVTLELGYSELSVFCRKFKIYFGYTPGSVVSDKDS